MTPLRQRPPHHPPKDRLQSQADAVITFTARFESNGGACQSVKVLSGVPLYGLYARAQAGTSAEVPAERDVRFLLFKSQEACETAFPPQTPPTTQQDQQHWIDQEDGLCVDASGPFIPHVTDVDTPGLVLSSICMASPVPLSSVPEVSSLTLNVVFDMDDSLPAYLVASTEPLASYLEQTTWNAAKKDVESPCSSPNAVTSLCLGMGSNSDAFTASHTSSSAPTHRTISIQSIPEYKRIRVTLRLTYGSRLPHTMAILEAQARQTLHALRAAGGAGSFDFSVPLPLDSTQLPESSGSPLPLSRVRPVFVGASVSGPQNKPGVASQTPALSRRASFSLRLDPSAVLPAPPDRHAKGPPLSALAEILQLSLQRAALVALRDSLPPDSLQLQWTLASSRSEDRSHDIPAPNRHLLDQGTRGNGQGPSKPRQLLELRIHAVVKDSADGQDPATAKALEEHKAALLKAFQSQLRILGKSRIHL